MTGDYADDDISKAEIKTIIDHAFTDLAVRELPLERVDTEHGTAIKFTINSHIGAMQCLYLLDPVVKMLLKSYPKVQYAGAAESMLIGILFHLPIATAIGMNNAHDCAKLVTQEGYEALASIVPELADKVKNGNAKSRRAEVLKRINRRNTMLVERPKSGKDATVTNKRLAAATGRLMAEGTPLEQITAQALAMRLGCEENSIHRALERQGSSLKEFLASFKRVDN
jgi:hypothetical protein